MDGTHPGHEAYTVVGGPLPWLAAVFALGYLAMLLRQRGASRPWSSWRTAGFLTGATLLALAGPAGNWPWPSGDFRGHMVQHLLIGMVAPLFLTLGAPFTLVFRTVPRRWGRRLGRLTHARPIRLLVHPVTALVLNVGGLIALYATPLHTAADADPVVHHVVHAHFLIAGYLFAWVIAGPDPAPRRPSMRARLVLLGVAILVHTVLSQLLFAGIIGSDSIPAHERRGAAELMYYGGDIAELLLALAALTAWRPRRREPRSAPSELRADRLAADDPSPPRR